MTCMYERSIEDFLGIFYACMETKLKRIIELNSKDITSSETRELYETKSNLIEVLEYMHMLTSDEEMKRLFNVLASLIASTDTHKLEQALNFCIRIRST